METRAWKKKGKNEPTHFLLQVIQWNGIERLQQDTNMQINNKIKTITQNLAIEKRTLIKFVSIFMGAPCLELHHSLVLNLGAPRVETLLVHQYLASKIAQPKGFCYQTKLKKQKKDNWFSHPSNVWHWTLEDWKQKMFGNPNLGHWILKPTSILEHKEKKTSQISKLWHQT